MHDAGKIIAGLIVFLILITFPFWYNAAGFYSGDKPDLKIITDAKQCVESKEYMKANHMNLLDDWRDRVVRGQERYITLDGKRYEMSLTNTCLGCHSNKADFCDQCHNYMDVDPYCWDCHIESKE